MFDLSCVIIAKPVDRDPVDTLMNKLEFYCIKNETNTIIRSYLTGKDEREDKLLIYGTC